MQPVVLGRLGSQCGSWPSRGPFVVLDPMAAPLRQSRSPVAAAWERTGASPLSMAEQASLTNSINSSADTDP
jgi:hypothetical protein